MAVTSRVGGAKASATHYAPRRVQTRSQSLFGSFSELSSIVEDSRRFSKILGRLLAASQDFVESIFLRSVWSRQLFGTISSWEEAATHFELLGHFPSPIAIRLEHFQDFWQLSQFSGCISHIPSSPWKSTNWNWDIVNYQWSSQLTFHLTAEQSN